MNPAPPVIKTRMAAAEATGCGMFRAWGRSRGTAPALQPADVPRARGAGRGTSEIHVMNADGSGKRRLTRNKAIDDQAPSWSPDGRWISLRGVETSTSCARRLRRRVLLADRPPQRRTAEATHRGGFRRQGSLRREEQAQS